MSSNFPPAFAELEPLADWAVPTEGARYARRLSCGMDELQAFYDAVFPRLDDAIEHLGQYDELSVLPDDAKRLLWLFCALTTVSFPVEVWRQARVPDSGAAAIEAVAEPAV